MNDVKIVKYIDCQSDDYTLFKLSYDVYIKLNCTLKYFVNYKKNSKKYFWLLLVSNSVWFSLDSDFYYRFAVVIPDYKIPTNRNQAYYITI